MAFISPLSFRFGQMAFAKAYLNSPHAPVVHFGQLTLFVSALKNSVNEKATPSSSQVALMAPPPGCFIQKDLKKHNKSRAWN
jgi:hypothetical protein